VAKISDYLTVGEAAEYLGVAKGNTTRGKLGANSAVWIVVYVLLKSKKTMLSLGV